MIFSLDDRSVELKEAGGKATNLMILKAEGFPVPNGYVLGEAVFERVLQENGIKNRFDKVVNSFSKENVIDSSKSFIKLFEKVKLPEKLKTEIQSFVDEDKFYAIRSSGMKEDLSSYSFAGQYKSFLSVKGINSIEDKVIECYKSMFSEGILSYFADNEIGLSNYSMAVIVQEMVEADKSGVAFSINPVSGNDREIVIDAAFGFGESLVGGQIKADTYYYNWYDEKVENLDSFGVLSEKEVLMIAKTVLDIQVFFGYPCDVEFAIKGGKLFVLQSRPITKILYGGIKDQWTTADFKDGGVSSRVCTPYMWSLYEYVWEHSFGAFLLDSKLLIKKELRKAGEMFYGRPYWNLSMAKLAMSKVPGYKEREFDEEIGVKINYEGNGDETKITLKSLFQIIKIVLGSKKVLEQQLPILKPYKKESLEKYEYYLKQDIISMTFEDLQSMWYQLVKADYIKNESIYFRQIFINIVHQTLLKDKLLKVVDKNEYLNLLSGLENISHLLPFYKLWDIGREIVQDKKAYKYWKETEVEDIVRDYDRDTEKMSRKGFRELYYFIGEFGYHSIREIDVTYPHFSEDLSEVIKQLKEVVLLTEDHSPYANRDKQQKLYKEQLKVMRERSRSEAKYKKLLKSVHKMRDMLWWREELRDLSTRFYYIIRLYTLRLAEHYCRQGVIANKEDIFYLKIKDLFDWIEGKKARKDLQRIVDFNKKYYNSFRNFTNENEVGGRYSSIEKNEIEKTSVIKGVGCNNMRVTATARVIESIEDIDRLQKGDILVTRFTDTGWTSKFAVLSGVVTEYGGILCHAAIVSREYGIPCIVCVDNATKLIKDGSTITIDAATGEIILN